MVAQKYRQVPSQPIGIFMHPVPSAVTASTVGWAPRRSHILAKKNRKERPVPQGSSEVGDGEVVAELVPDHPIPSPSRYFGS